MGDSGTGKSTSLRYLDPKKSVIIKPNAKRLPFRGAGKVYSEKLKNLFTVKDFKKLRSLLLNINDNAPHVKYITIEDLTHFFTAREMQDKNVIGFGKWADLAEDTFNALVELETMMRDDLFIFLLAHTKVEDNGEGGKRICLQTPGKMLESKVMLPSYFTYVLHTYIPEDRSDYFYLTQHDGVHEAKSPMGCLERLEPNDLNIISKKIEDYQNDEYQSSEESCSEGADKAS